MEVYPLYLDGLRDLEGFDHLILLYQFHLASKELLRVTPFLDDVERGVFATRAPTRPNRIGLSVVRLLGINGTRLDIGSVDMVSGKPVIDIKPYAPAFDSPVPGRIGWSAGRLGWEWQFLLLEGCASGVMPPARRPCGRRFCAVRPDHERACNAATIGKE